jgi:hypothetical protein
VSVLEYLLPVAAGIFFLILWLHERKRTADIKGIASRYKFHYLDTALPGSLSLAGTPIARASKTWNVIDGERDGIRIVAFDCRIGEGKRSWRRTVIAAQTPLDIFRSSQFNYAPVERSGEWVIMYRPQTFFRGSVGLMSAAELEAHIEAIRATQ